MATEKQKRYAEDIAEYLGLELPSEEHIPEFISRNKERFNRELYFETSLQEILYEDCGDIV